MPNQENDQKERTFFGCSRKKYCILYYNYHTRQCKHERRNSLSLRKIANFALSEMVRFLRHGPEVQNILCYFFHCPQKVSATKP